MLISSASHLSSFFSLWNSWPASPAGTLKYHPTSRKQEKREEKKEKKKNKGVGGGVGVGERELRE